MNRRFEVICEGDDWEDAKAVSSWDHSTAAEDLGDWFWSECDGWEWMREGSHFLVRPVDDPEDVKRVHIEVDFRPIFFGLETE